MPKEKTEKINEKTEEAKEEPKQSEKPKKLSQKDYEKKVLELSKKGLTAEKIGSELQKQGIHPREYEGKISKILGQDYVDPELINIGKKLENIEQHMKKNKQDKRALREKSRVFSQRKKRREYLQVRN
jgi:ribosomal protein S15P/S13E